MEESKLKRIYNLIIDFWQMIKRTPATESFDHEFIEKVYEDGKKTMKNYEGPENRFFENMLLAYMQYLEDVMNK